MLQTARKEKKKPFAPLGKTGHSAIKQTSCRSIADKWWPTGQRDNQTASLQKYCGQC